VRCGPIGVRGVGGVIRCGSRGAMSERTAQGYCGAAFMMLAVTGRLNATLEPGQGPFSTIHITDMDLELTEQIDLSYRWFLLGDGWQALNSRVAHCSASEKQAATC